MKLKKTITIILLSIMTMLILSTTAMAVTYNKYNLAYSYSGTGNEMKWVVKGTDTKVKTKATNPTSYSRYIESTVKKMNYYTRTYISSNSDSNTGKQMYVLSKMSRSPTNSNIYYVHQATLKPSATSGYTIDSLYYEITQIPSY